MDYNYREKKIVAVVDSKVDIGVALNVVGHLSVALGAYGTDLMGRAVLYDESNVPHMGISRYPLIITKSNSSKIRAAIQKAKCNSNLTVADYPLQMLETGHDDELAERLKQTPEENIQYLGALFFGPTNEVNEITKKFSLYR